MSISFGICPTGWRTGRSEPWSAPDPAHEKMLGGKVRQLDDSQAVHLPWKNLDRQFDPDNLKVLAPVRDEDDTLDEPCFFLNSRPRHKPRGNDRLLCAALVGHWSFLCKRESTPRPERKSISREKWTQASPDGLEARCASIHPPRKHSGGALSFPCRNSI